MGRGAVAADFDRDGDVDISVSRTNQPMLVLSNETTSGANWLTVRLIGVKSPREPIGAMAKLTTRSGTQIRMMKSGGSYASSSSDRIFFGTGEDSDALSLEISWPSGETQTIVQPHLNQQLQIVESVDQRPSAVIEAGL